MLFFAWPGLDGARADATALHRTAEHLSCHAERAPQQVPPAESNAQGISGGEGWSAHSSQGGHQASLRNQSQPPPGTHVGAFPAGQARDDKQVCSASVDHEDIIWATIPEWLLSLTQDGHPTLCATQASNDSNRHATNNTRAWRSESKRMLLLPPQ
ncbi:hypothetical protein K437DRAFT_257267 [Tilletiaria anomala UBC 951]|uniref:Uncharacterized protein n=1 Tax=Tilletiaria anomala (strain ATCC 24038 / CBS 436.72 / UBC 951) TaxID=1037660 RepID=A0A066VR79_TILAU|nr:uncharacterized protein K437DRAFT_257267 [Tilletiaria anomala UBC 951]KDN43961.1 hypothetical protein K437DRAFT_257267 [Tilletiaria anomala UBC 951]